MLAFHPTTACPRLRQTKQKAGNGFAEPLKEAKRSFRPIIIDNTVIGKLAMNIVSVGNLMVMLTLFAVGDKCRFKHDLEFVLIWLLRQWGQEYKVIGFD
ncbi:hypothetical protein AVEN_149442-1 [Araneus ventricosus]|uniref:Uncharacterized protein n=1 Tax=Araneus ventricosus TaxID=182803 RepID=A0A4Y2JH04_ARAVE|nr:hypothetical protein AVEN_149442-1 [Araneus ventricosus]